MRLKCLSVRLFRLRTHVDSSGRSLVAAARGYDITAARGHDITGAA